MMRNPVTSATQIQVRNGASSLKSLHQRLDTRIIIILKHLSLVRLSKGDKEEDVHKSLSLVSSPQADIHHVT